MWMNLGNIDSCSFTLSKGSPLLLHAEYAELSNCEKHARNEPIIDIAKVIGNRGAKCLVASN